MHLYFGMCVDKFPIVKLVPKLQNEQIQKQKSEMKENRSLPDLMLTTSIKNGVWQVSPLNNLHFF